MRPKLDKNIKPSEFINFYWLKEELLEFCKENKIPRSGSKKDITERISKYLETGEIVNVDMSKRIKKTEDSTELTLDSRIPENYKNDERHRMFFKEIIGEHFKFNIQFMSWMKENSGKTYQEAVNEWNQVYSEKKAGKKNEISYQFEYNQYTRNFFSANPNLTRDQAIKCWKYKKSLPGSNKYEDKDLEILKNE